MNKTDQVPTLILVGKTFNNQIEIYTLSHTICYYVEHGLVEPESPVRRQFQELRRGVHSLYEDESGGVGQKLSDSGYILQVQPKGFAGRLDVQ